MALGTFRGRTTFNMSESKHISDDDIEAYHMGVEPDAQLMEIEEHLLWCHDCLDRMEAAGRYVDTVRRAAIRGNFDVVPAEGYRHRGKA